MLNAIIMAAGGGKRFGSVKQLRCYNGKSLVRIIGEKLTQVSCFSRVIAVTGCENQRVAGELQDLPLLICDNKEWQQGQSTSIKCGLQMLSDDCCGVMFFVADQPLLAIEVIKNLVAIWQTDRSHIVVPRCQGLSGNPVIFPWPLYENDFSLLSGDEGAKGIWRQNMCNVTFLECCDTMSFCDIDREADLQKLINENSGPHVD